MQTKEKVAALYDAYELRQVGGTEKIVLNEKSPLYDAMRGAQFHLNERTGSFETDYSIMRDACYAIAEADADDVNDINAYELSSDTASVYTAEQLSWLNINNQADIADIVKEYDSDIGTACAVWYEQQVADAIELIIQEVINNDAI